MVGVQEAAAIAVAKKAAEAVASDIYKNTTTLAKKSLDRLLLEFGVGINTYLRRNYERCRYVKTLLHRTDPISIESAYIDPLLNLQKQSILGSELLTKLPDLKRLIIVGLGGSGKSMFMKNAFLEFCTNPFGKIPLFIELRDLNGMEEKDLLRCILNPLSALIPSFNIARLEYGLSAGKFILLLDGLDEIDPDLRDECSKQLLNLTYRFPQCSIVLTSRPDERFVGWNEFYSSSILPLSQKQVIELINKVQFDEETKESFLQQIKGSLYSTHKAFLSNPLLCTMMLMTYAEFEEIPSKIYIFYSRAFDVLFIRHDRTKPSFKRKFYTKLAEDDFKRLFSTFCLLTYLDRKISFDEDTAKKYIRQVIAHEKKPDVSVDDFLKDLSESISILVRDGTILSFLHRSFQEYFVAVFLSERVTEQMEALFDKVAHGSGENVVSVLIEMNRDAFETKYFVKAVRKTRKVLDKIDLSVAPQKMLAMLYDRVELEEGELRSIHFGKFHHIFSLLDRFYFKNKLQIGLFVDSPSSGFSASAWEEYNKVFRAAFPGSSSSKRRRRLVRSLPSSSIINSEILKILKYIKSETQRVDSQFRWEAKESSEFVSDLLLGLR